MSDNQNPGLISCLIKISKLRVVILLQVTAICAILAHDLLVRHGSIVGERTWFDTIWTSFITLIGGTLAAGGSNAINMWYDRDIDPLMSRTKNRPLPMGWISPNTVLMFGIITSLGGSALFLTLHWKAAFWSLFSVIFYVFIYSIWLKRRTPQNIVIGGAAGATPPVIGWASAASAELSGTNPFDLGSPIPWMFFMLVFLWTPPHFWALAIMIKDDYERAKIPMLPNIKGEKNTSIQMMFYTIVLSIFVISFTFVTDRANEIYLFGSSILCVLFIYYSIKLIKNINKESALKTYKYSLLFLTLVWVLMIVGSIENNI